MLLKFCFLITYFILVFIGVRFLDLFLSFLTHNEFKNVGNFLSKYMSYWVSLSNVSCVNEDPEFMQKPEKLFSDNVKETILENNKQSDISYDDLMERVEDTKASIWVVKVLTKRKSNDVLNSNEWKNLAAKLGKYGIRTAIYRCNFDPRLCMHQKIENPTILLTTPQGSQPKGNVSFQHYVREPLSSFGIDHVYRWIQKRLYLRVKKVHSLSEVTNQVVSRLRQVQTAEPSLSFIYQTNKKVPPLILTSLSVKFTGRIKFYLLQSEDPDKQENIFAMNKYFKYSYGNHKGESFNYSCIELFLKTLHPEINDVFVITVVLLNMACWLELFLQKGGPIRRVLYYVWGFTMTNIILVFIWLPIIQLICLPQVQPLLQLFLKSFQKVMFTNIAAILRQDFMHISQHLHVVIVGFICYGVFLGYLRHKFGDETQQWSSFRNVLSNDIEELLETVNSLIIFMTPSLQIYRFEEHIERILQRLMMQDLWLHNPHSNDYIRELPTWKFCTCEVEPNHEYGDVITDNEVSSESENDSSNCAKENFQPSYMILSEECVICLRSYKCQDHLMGISCGHSFHQVCLVAWLLTGNSQRRCPVCRWPADISKGKLNIIDLVDP